MMHLLCRFARLFSLIFAVIIFCSALVLAQVGKVEVKRNVNLRPDPSIQNDPITLLRPPKQLELLEPEKTEGYYHVRDEEGEEGWVWAKNVRRIEINGLIPDTTVTTPAIVQHISKSWQKFVPEQTTFNGSEGTCRANGDGSDPDQYILKNRSDVPPNYHNVTFDAVDELPFPGKGANKKAPANRRNWLPKHFAITDPYESIPIRLEGYIIVIRDQKKSTPGKGEGTNCGFVTLGNIDAHIALVENKNDPESSAIVVEWTPRFTQAHPNWTSQKLKPWIKTGKRVRISGWLMVDPNHLNHITGVKINGQIRKYRHTLWEIHPITRIEVWKDGSFVDLDDLP
jgi:hypothetical protein